MKKMLMALVLALLCMVSACALADGYKRGDKVEDFTATLSDGSTFTLSEVLKEKKAVLLNFWASWCSPCKMEMPSMNRAYKQISDDVAFICLSIEESDTNDTIAQLRESLGLDVLPMGLDTDNLYEKFDNPEGGIPFTVAIDKNGVICFSECGTIPDESKFLSLMGTFTAEDYDEPQMVYDIPSLAPNVEPASDEELHAAIGAEGMGIINSDNESIWPFLVSEDGTYAYASNSSVKDSTAAFMVTVDAKAGEGIAFEYSVDCVPAYMALWVSFDGSDIPSEIMAGSKDWTQNVLTFDEDGTHTVAFAFTRDTTLDGEAFAAIRNVRKVSEEETEEICAAMDQGVATLEGETAEIEVLEGSFKTALMDLGGATTEMQILEDGSSVKLRIRIGKDVDVAHAYLSDGSTNIMLSDLERDDEGYIYVPVTEIDENTIDLSAFVGKNISVYASVMQRSEDTMPLATLNFQLSEDTMDMFVEFLNMAFGSELEQAGATITWSYQDGSAKKSDAEEDLPDTMNADGTANYTVMVTDKDGRGLEKAMVQVCTNEICQVYFTDADGMVQFTNAPYAYEIHILKVPDGFVRPVETYLLPQEGGSLIIQVNAE